MPEPTTTTTATASVPILTAFGIPLGLTIEESHKLLKA